MSSSYLHFEFVNVNDKLRQQFHTEATGLGLDKLLTTHKKALRIVFHKAIDTPDVYLVMVVGHHDQILIQLANSCSFPRGFPILWIPGTRMQYFGFYPKFENDDRQTPDDQTEFNNIQSIHFFKKWSGFLGQLMFFTINNQKYWTVTSKNSAGKDSPFIEDGKRLFEPFINQNLIDHMIDNNLHICAEVMSQRDQVHGSRVSKESPIITSIGKGCIFNLQNPQQNIYGTKFVEFLDHINLVKLCVKFGLPCDSAIIINNGALDFIKKLSSRRDFMTDSELQNLISECSTNITIHKGTVVHSDILGNCLEGLVLKIIHTNGSVTVKKYKFPYYTIRTMLFRTQFQNFAFSQTLKREAKRFSEHWCVTDKGTNYWYNFGLQGFINKLTFKTPDSNIGDHIHIAESITLTKEMKEIEQEFNELAIKLSNGTIIICVGPIGSGKTSTMKSISSLDPTNYVPIDGDELGFTLDLVLKFGKERNDYSKWLVIKALMERKIPVISTGGGILFNTGKNLRFVLRDYIYSTLGILPKIILMLPIDQNNQNNQITQLDNTYDPSKLYDDTGSVRKVVNRRISTKEWKIDPKFKNVDQFASFIAGKSKENYKFAMQLLNTADHIFGFPVISDKNYGIQTKLDYSSIINLINPINYNFSGKFGQIRVLTMIGSEIGHITYEFSSNNDIEYSLEKFTTLSIICDSLKDKSGKINGQVITLTSANKKNSLSVAFPNKSIHDDNCTHITVNPGSHAPKEMKSVVKAYKSGDKTITLPVNNSKNVVEYNFDSVVLSPCTIEILDVFGI